jgi:DNA-binding NtrC family response regulator
MAGTTTLEGSLDGDQGVAEASATEVRALVVVWASQPERIGEVLLVTPEPRLFGRGGAEVGEEAPRIDLVRQLPGANEPRPPVEHPFLSRQHLRLSAIAGDGVRVENLGKRPVTIDGREVTSEIAPSGAIVEIRGLFLFLVTRRPIVFRALDLENYPIQPCGLPDPFGIVGESPPTWELRDRIAFFAGRSAHVLITGASGTGKELVAQAIHALSSRRALRLVARNAATLPVGLIDAELFGNAANYPQSGMAERPGLVGEAHESTLFLDEIGELPLELQAHLLRVLDDGEYQRLGEAKRRRANFRLIAATNRPPEELKHDLLARLGLRLEVPDLNRRREDVTLIARHLLRRTASRDPPLGARFFSNWDGRHGDPRIGAELARALVGHPYSTHARELDALLWRSLSTSRGGFADLTEEVRAELARPAPERPGGVAVAEGPKAPGAADDRSLASGRVPSADEVRAALARHQGVRERAWRELGLPSRHALHRLLKKYGLGEDDAPT